MKRKKQRVFSVGLAAGLAIALTACGTGKSSSAETISRETEAEENSEIQQATETIQTETEEPAPEDTETAEAGIRLEEGAESSDENYDFTLCFAGDLSLADDAITTYNLNNSENGIFDCISPVLVTYMQCADLMCLNNEFTYSTRGSALSGKAYTFRGDPERVSVLSELSVDAVTLANNHVYDYGPDALEDTFTTLENADIEYFGAGRNLEQAMEPTYFELDGKTVALVAASRAEKNLYTPQATEDSAGILRCYDTTLFLQEITEAKANADYVIAFVHWGTEYSTVLESAQTETAHEYIDAGADAIIGAHSHCIQGVEYYKDCPIFYSLGNYWFNSKTLYSMLVNLEFEGEGDDRKLTAQVIPALQSGGKTAYIGDLQEQSEYFEYLEGISVNVTFDEKGYVYEK